MFNSELTSAVENFATVMLPLSEKDLAINWAWKDHTDEGLRFSFFVTIQELRQLSVGLASDHKPLTQAQQILGQYHKQYMDLQSAVFRLFEEDGGLQPKANGLSGRCTHIFLVQRLVLAGSFAMHWKVTVPAHGNRIK